MADPPPSDSLLRRKSDSSFLLGDETLADLTIRIKIKPAEAAAADAAAATRAEGAEAEAGPAAKHARTDGGGDDAAHAHAAQQQEQEDDDAGLVATIRAHAAVLAQRSGYFKGLVLGGGAHMADGRAKTGTVEVGDAQGKEEGG